MFRLKPGVPNFTMTDGPFARRSYVKGETYAEADIPPSYKDRFEEMPAAEPKKKK